MAADPLMAFVRRLRDSLGASPVQSLSDDELVRQFVQQQDEATFALLVHRHGPMVWGVCRRLLHRAEDAEDAFQATFLVFVRKAGSLRRRDLLAGWLHGVACRTARTARLREVRRRFHERQAAGSVQETSSPEITLHDAGPLLEEEIRRLPESYRLPVVLCHLQGLTYQQAARQLGWAEGTVSGRLARARARLRQRLVQRGVTPSVATGVLGTQLALAAPPAGLIASTFRIALSPSRETIVPAQELSRQVLGEMAMTPMRRLAGLLAVLVLVGLTAGLLMSRTPAVGVEPTRSTELRVRTGSQPADQLGEALPEGALARLGTLHFRHAGPVMHTAFSPDGKVVASAGLDGTVRLWEAATGKPRREIAASVGQPEFPWFGGTLTFSPDGKVLALARYHLTFWDPQTGNFIERLRWRPADVSFVAVRFCPDGTILAAARAEDSLRVFDMTAQKEVHRFPSRGRVNTAALSFNGKTLAAVDQDRQSQQFLCLWDLTTGKEVRPPEALPGPNSAVIEWSPDGNHLAVANDGQIRVLNWSTGKESGRWKVDVVGCLSFSPDGTILAAGNDQEVDLWQVSTGKKVQTLRGFQWTQAVAFSPDGQRLAVGSGWTMHRYHPVDDQTGGTVDVWDLTGDVRVGPRQVHQSSATCVAFAPDGKMLASGSRDRTVRLWETASGREVQILTGHQGEILAVAYAADGKRLASGSRDKTVRVWDPASGKTIHTWTNDGPVYAVAFAPDGKSLAVADTQGVRLWDTATGKERRHWRAEKESPVYALAFAPDGRTLAWGGGLHVFLPDWGSNAVHLVDVATGAENRLLPQQNGSMAVCSLAFSPDGKTLAAGYMNTALRLWDPAGGKLIHTIQTRAEGTVVFAPDGKTLASVGGLSATIFLYETATYGERGRIESGQGGVHGVAFSPDGRKLASAGRDTTVMLWSIGGRKP